MTAYIIKGTFSYFWLTMGNLFRYCVMLFIEDTLPSDVVTLEN